MPTIDNKGKKGIACFNGNHKNCSYTVCGCPCHSPTPEKKGEHPVVDFQTTVCQTRGYKENGEIKTMTIHRGTCKECKTSTPEKKCICTRDGNCNGMIPHMCKNCGMLWISKESPTCPNKPSTPEKCKKHGVVHKNGGYPSCPTPEKKCESWEERFDEKVFENSTWFKTRKLMIEADERRRIGEAVGDKWRLARFMHEKYERYAFIFGWNTQEEIKKTMLAVADDILSLINKE